MGGEDKGQSSAKHKDRDGGRRIPQQEHDVTFSKAYPVAARRAQE